jgi:hypothetical protein
MVLHSTFETIGLSAIAGRIGHFLATVTCSFLEGGTCEYPLPNGKMIKNILTNPQTIEISEMFQIRDGKIDQIEAVINSVPYGMKSEVWDK